MTFADDGRVKNSRELFNGVPARALPLHERHPGNPHEISSLKYTSTVDVCKHLSIPFPVVASSPSSSSSAAPPPPPGFSALFACCCETSFLLFSTDDDASRIIAALCRYFFRRRRVIVSLLSLACDDFSPFFSRGKLLQNFRKSIRVVRNEGETEKQDDDPKHPSRGGDHHHQDHASDVDVRGEKISRRRAPVREKDARR